MIFHVSRRETKRLLQCKQEGFLFSFQQRKHLPEVRKRVGDYTCFHRVSKEPLHGLMFWICQTVEVALRHGAPGGTSITQLEGKASLKVEV